MGDQFTSVSIKVESIESVHLWNNNPHTMKPPKLPGTEKFKFSDKKYSDCRTDSVNNETDGLINPSNFIRGIPSRSTCPLTPSVVSLPFEPTFNRLDSKRKPILPISSRMTSRVLTLTHLPMDSFEIRDSNCKSLRQNYAKGPKLSKLSKLSVSCEPRVATTTSTSRVSLFSDCSGSHCSSSQPSPRSLCSGLERRDRSLTPSQWPKNIHTHRLSTSSQSSWEDGGPESHDSFWITRK